MDCGKFKELISECLNEDSPLPDSLKSHLDGCKSCRDFHRFSVVLETQLRQEAMNFKKPRRSMRRRIALTFLHPALAAPAATALIALSFIAIMWTPEPPQTPLLAESSQEFPLPSLDAMIDMSAIQYPPGIATELANLQSDTRNAMEFLIASANLTPDIMEQID